MANVFSPNKAEQEQLFTMRRILNTNQQSVKRLIIDKGHLNRNHQFISMSKTQEKFG